MLIGKNTVTFIKYSSDAWKKQTKRERKRDRQEDKKKLSQAGRGGS